MGLPAILLWLLTWQDPDIPLILKKSLKNSLKLIKASSHFQIETFPRCLSAFPQHPKVMMSDTLFLLWRALEKLFLSKRGRKLLLGPERDPWYILVSKGESYIYQHQKRVHTISCWARKIQAYSARSLSYQGEGTAFQYQHRAPICDPSVLGGHRYTHSLSCNLRRIPRQKGCWSSKLSFEGRISHSQHD